MYKNYTSKQGSHLTSKSFKNHISIEATFQVNFYKLKFEYNGHYYQIIRKNYCKKLQDKGVI